MKNIYVLLTKNVVEAQKYILNLEEHLNSIHGSRLPISAYLHRQSQGTERLEDQEYKDEVVLEFSQVPELAYSIHARGAEKLPNVFRNWQIVRNCKVTMM
jgi:hypothetical protein